MGEIVKRFPDGSFLEYGQGRFDNWCVFFTSGNGRRSVPRDEDYFNRLKQLADKYGAERIYSDYTYVYNVTSKEVEESVLAEISRLADAYGGDALEMDVLLSTIYMTMIAEERKRNSILRKRIKRLGIHQILFENYSAAEAANFTRGKRWYEIDKLCKERKF